MQKIYIDESGSQTKANAGSHPFFTIAMVKALDERELKKSYRRFINKYMEQIEESDLARRQQMFADGRFLELKGSSFTPQLKKSFAKYFAAKPCFELYYIRFDNSRTDTVFYENTARACSRAR